jgi:YidC/Oxa1 family membrane protein insertase
LTEQEQFSEGLVKNLPFVIAFFSLNVPSGLSLYWVVNNILTTGITLAVKSNIKDEAMPPEVDEIMAIVASGSGGAVPQQQRGPSAARQEFMTSSPSSVSESRPSGFSIPDSSFPDAGGGGADDIVDVEIVESAEEVVPRAEEEAAGGSSQTATPKRKKRTKPAQKKK